MVAVGKRNAVDRPGAVRRARVEPDNPVGLDPASKLDQLVFETRIPDIIRSGGHERDRRAPRWRHSGNLDGGGSDTCAMIAAAWRHEVRKHGDAKRDAISKDDAAGHRDKARRRWTKGFGRRERWGREAVVSAFDQRSSLPPSWGMML